MHLNVNIILIISVCQFITILPHEVCASSESEISSEETGEVNGLKNEIKTQYHTDPEGNLIPLGKHKHDHETEKPESPESEEGLHRQGIVKEDCHLFVPYEDYNMPIPISINTSSPQVLYPDKNGIITIKQYGYIKVACSGSKFQHPLNLRTDMSELTLKCLGKTLLENNGKIYQWDKVKCVDIPKATSVLTRKKCLTKYSIVNIGFQISNSLVKTYQICFDMWTKNTLYSWFKIKTPLLDMRQISPFKPEFIKSPLFGDVDLPFFYRRQLKEMEILLRSRLIARKYIRRLDGEHFLDAGQLLSPLDFNYIFEQDATFFYENTAPMWRLFLDGIWNDVEKLFQRNLMAAKNGTHVIVAGTYGVCTLADKSNAQQAVILIPPRSLLAPQYVWKMDYDLETQTGVVYIALNDPYSVITKESYICETIPCPGKMVRRCQTRSLHFCCTKESFEKVFGQFDLSLFEQTA